MLPTLKLSVIIFVFILSTTPVISLDKNITIALNKVITKADKQLYGEFIYLNRSSRIKINFSDLNKNISFIILQAHSHLYNIDVYKNLKTRGSYISGTNIGQYSSTEPLTDVYYIENSNKNIDLKLYVAVHGYMEIDPIPGGCNMEFPLPISPYIRPTYNNDYVLVDAAPARSQLDPNCIKANSVNNTFHMMYLPEMNFDTDVYFDGITAMMNVKSIETNGVIIPETQWATRRKVSAYPGVGTIYVAIARVGKDAYSIYVPAYTYACRGTVIENGCNLMDDYLTQFLCAALLFTGIFVCYLGHRFFKTEMFLVGFMSGFLITYILISLIAILDRAALVTASALSGVFFGAMWLMFWWLYGIPVLAVMLAFMNVGFLLASIVYYRLPVFFVYPLTELIFWTFFVVIMLLTALALVSLTYVANMVSCAILGSYATVFSMDYYVGANLKYVLINTIRKAVVPNFSNTVLMPPFQVRDLLLTLLWVIMAITGLLFQIYYNRGRPPFPPPPRSIRPEPPAYNQPNQHDRERLNIPPTVTTADERTPLLS